MPDQPPSMRAASPWERLAGALAGAYETLQQQPLAQLLGLIGEQVGQGFRGNLDEDWSIGALPYGPGRVSLPGQPAAGVRRPVTMGGVGNVERPAAPPRPGLTLPRTGAIPGRTLDEILAAGEAAYPEAATMQVIEPGTGAVIDPAREAALRLARTRAGR